jgi:ferrochelatase
MVELRIGEKTLFQTSFFYKEKYFDRILIAPLFLTDFKKILSFFENYDLDYNIQFDKPLKHFQAQFISPSFQAIDFGKTQKVLIYEENKSLFLEAITYLELNTKWAKKIIINPKKWNLNRFFEYDCIDDIIHILHNNNFHFAFIGGIEKELLEKQLLNKNKLEKKFFNPTLDLS